MMKKIYRLRERDDFKVLFGKGRRVDSSLFRVVYRGNTIGHVRLAFVTPQSTDKRAVKRNLLRRRAREWIRKRKNLTCLPLDLALIFKKEAINASKKTFYEELDKLFSRIVVV